MGLLALNLACLVATFSIVAGIVFWLRFAAPSARPALSDEVEPTQSPPAVLVMCLRGRDPFLSETLRAVRQQNYPNYRVIIVVDHAADPSMNLVRNDQLESTWPDRRWNVQTLQNPALNRGLKCSALIQAAESCGEEEIFVTLDSDAVPGPDWLPRLLAPLQSPHVGAVTSGQWFEPQSWQLGTWVRSVWHAGAIVPTAVLGHAWAGAFAMRTSDIKASGLLDAWATSIIDDGPVESCLRAIGKELRFVPENLVINREDCGLKFCFRYIARMLFWSRLFESTFWITYLHMMALLSAHLIIAVHAAVAVYGIVAPPDPLHSSHPAEVGQASTDLWLAFGAGLILLLGQVVGYFLVRHTVMTHHPQVQTNAVLRRVLMTLVAIPLTLSAYACGATRAWFGRKIVWRQAVYAITAAHDVTLQPYQAYSDSPNNCGSV